METEIETSTDCEPETEPATRAALLQPSTTNTDLPDIGNEPNQPWRHQFPKRSFGKKMSSTTRFNLHGLIDGSGCIMILREIWLSVLPV